MNENYYSAKYSWWKGGKLFLAMAAAVLAANPPANFTEFREGFFGYCLAIFFGFFAVGKNYAKTYALPRKNKNGPQQHNFSFYGIALACVLALGACAYHKTSLEDIRPGGESLIIKEVTSATWGGSNEESTGAVTYSTDEWSLGVNAGVQQQVANEPVATEQFLLEIIRELIKRTAMPAP